MDDTRPDHVTTASTACEPAWEPLERLLPVELCALFMSMYQSTTHEGPVIHAYKHVDTRRYLFIDEVGETWRYTGGEVGSYCRIALGGALEEAFRGWGDLTGYTAEHGKLVAELIAAARTTSRR